MGDPINTLVSSGKIGGSPIHRFSVLSVDGRTGTSEAIIDSNNATIRVRMEVLVPPFNIVTTTAQHDFRVAIYTGTGSSRVLIGQALGSAGASTANIVVPLDSTMLQSMNDGATPLTIDFENRNAGKNGIFSLGVQSAIIDRSAPSISLPSGGLRNTGLTFTAQDLGTGIQRVELNDNGTNVLLFPSTPGDCNHTVPLSYNFAAQGQHAITVTATDRLNRATTVSQTYDFDSIALSPGPPDLAGTSDTGTSATDDLTAAADPVFFVSGIEAGATATLLREGSSTVVAGTRNDVGTITDVGVLEGSYRYRVRQLDLAGNQSSPSPDLMVAVDRTAPSVNVSLSGNKRVFGDGGILTESARPAFDISVSESELNIENRVDVRLIQIDGVAVPVGPAQQLVFAGQPTLLGSGGSLITQQTTLEVPFDLAPGSHSVRFEAVDGAGNRSVVDANVTVLANGPLAALGTPVYSEAVSLDFDALKAFLDVDTANGEGSQPWTMSFDKRTQTVWFTFEYRGATRLEEAALGHFDPATNQLRIYRVEGLQNVRDAHGVFFDFNTHILPRVWFVHRNSPVSGQTQNPGRISYLELAPPNGPGGVFSAPRLVSYNLAHLAEVVDEETGHEFGFTDAHAIFVDDRGIVWASMADSNVLLELDFDSELPGSGTTAPTLNSEIASVRIHELPSEHHGEDEPRPSSETEDFAHPHGLEVIVSDKLVSLADGAGVERSYFETFVWYTNLPGGRIGLLRTLRQAAGPPGPQPADEWFEWDIDELLVAEKRFQSDGSLIGHGLFVAVDNRETPGNPRDDLIYLADPGDGRANTGFPAGAIRQLDPAELRGEAQSLIRTWQIPGRSSLSVPYAATNQPYVDRQGNVFFIDRLTGPGRFDPTISSGNSLAVTATRASSEVLAGLEFGPTDDPLVYNSPTLVQTFSLPVLTPLSATGTKGSVRATDGQAQAFSGGLDVFDLYIGDGKDARNGEGPFRGALDAGSRLLMSHARKDVLATTVFAESARRQPSVLAGPGTARMVFHVQRDGSLLLTSRGPNDVGYQQANLTSLISGPLIYGDTTAVKHNGIARVFGRGFDGGLVEYRRDPISGAWSAVVSHGTSAAGAGMLASHPTATIDTNNRVMVFATTNLGRLVMYVVDENQIVDLTSVSRGPRVYSRVDALLDGNDLFVYGTDMAGNLSEYHVVGNGPGTTARTVKVTAESPGQRVKVFQDVTVAKMGDQHHVFATDGTSRLVHIRVGGPSDGFAQNVTDLTQPTATGYAPFQQEFAARTYTGLTALVGNDGRMFVYGSNGAELILFIANQREDGGLDWQAHNLTNDILAPTHGPERTRLTGNDVFGAPIGFIRDNGNRHIFQVNFDGELIEYYILPEATGRFHTLNITLALESSTTDSPKSVAVSGSGVFDPSTGMWYLRRDIGPGPPDWNPFPFGGPGWQAVAGDFDGDGIDTVGVLDPTGTWYLRNVNTSGPPSIPVFSYGAGQWISFTGDWDGDGRDGIGVFDPATATWYLRNTPTAGAPDVAPFSYGGMGWIPVVGDFDGDGRDSIGVFDPTSATWYLKQSAGGGAPDIGPFQYGGAGWRPLVGDFNGNGSDSIAVVNPASFWFVRQLVGAGLPDLVFSYGAGGWSPIVGDWDGPALPLRLAAGGNSSAVLTSNRVSFASDEKASLGRLALKQLLGAAIDAWARDGLDLATSGPTIDLRVADLGDDLLGLSRDNVIWIDHDAAGVGWYVDETPYVNDEFVATLAPGVLRAHGGQVVSRVDALSVIAHELGHVFGLDDDFLRHNGLEHVMSGYLSPGLRRLPDVAAVDIALSESDLDE